MEVVYVNEPIVNKKRRKQQKVEKGNSFSIWDLPCTTVSGWGKLMHVSQICRGLPGARLTRQYKLSAAKELAPPSSSYHERTFHHDLT